MDRINNDCDTDSEGYPPFSEFGGHLRIRPVAANAQFGFLGTFGMLIRGYPQSFISLPFFPNQKSQRYCTNIVSDHCAECVHIMYIYTKRVIT